MKKENIYIIKFCWNAFLATFAILRDIIPNSLKETIYEDLLKNAKEHFPSRPSEIVERIKFQKRLWKQ